MRSYLIAFGCGAAVALGLTLRWQRMGSVDMPPDAGGTTPGEAAASGITTRARTAASNTSRAVVAGAKSDVGRLRRLPERIRPSHEADREADTAPVAEDQPEPSADGSQPVPAA